jgi:hypothetical protein
MQVLERDDAYFNFVNSINSEATRRNYEYCMSRFLKYCNLDLDSLLRIPQQELSNLIIRYLISLTPTIITHVTHEPFTNVV